MCNVSEKAISLKRVVSMIEKVEQCEKDKTIDPIKVSRFLSGTPPIKNLS
jgi:hypothetical protein